MFLNNHLSNISFNILHTKYLQHLHIFFLFPFLYNMVMLQNCNVVGSPFEPGPRNTVYVRVCGCLEATEGGCVWSGEWAMYFASMCTPYTSSHSYTLYPFSFIANPKIWQTQTHHRLNRQTHIHICIIFIYENGRDGTPNLITFCAHDLFRAKDFRSFYLLCKLKRKSIFIICRYLDFGDFSFGFFCWFFLLFFGCTFGMASAPGMLYMWTGGFVWIIMHFSERNVFIRVCRMDSCNKNILYECHNII